MNSQFDPNFPNQTPSSDLSTAMQAVKQVPLVAIRDAVIFPHNESVLTFGRPKSMAAVDAAYKAGQPLCIVTQKSAEVQDPQLSDLYQIGVLVKVEKMLLIEGIIHALVKGVSRIKLNQLVSTEPFLVVAYEDLVETVDQSDEFAAVAKHVTNQFKKAVNLGKAVDLGIFMRLMSGVDVGELADHIASALDIPVPEKQNLLETLVVNVRLQEIAKHLAHELKVLELEHSISHKTQRRMDKSMREAILRERRRTIDNELKKMGHGDERHQETDPEVAELKKKIKQAGMPEEVKKKADKELQRLSQMSMHNPERSYLQNYLDWLVEMPWSKSSDHKISLAEAEKVLDADHYGLKQAKERIIEYLAVMKLKQLQATDGEEKTQTTEVMTSDGAAIAKDQPLAEKSKVAKEQQTLLKKKEVSGPTILCFVGPPGVGKTSIGKSIAKALGREFVRISLGGIRDEAEIRGHRRTYIGALPGRIIQGIKNAGTNNPVFMLDEIDKIGSDFRGDPSSALLEALDPEQNREFSDHYLEVPFDLSKVMFITTANLLDTVPLALRDRLEIIEFSGYTEEEKIHIADKYLWPKQLGVHGLPKETVINDHALKQIIHHYTREAGVRNLERQLATICRKLARQVAENGKHQEQTVSLPQIAKYLGQIKYSSQLADKQDDIGVSTGLVYTSVGGGILFIEVAVMPGTGKLTLTGHLGQVMKESCQAAFSYVRTRWKALGLPKDFARKVDVHIHVPEGAVPKDGPSAGAAIATAIASALTKTPNRRYVAMTGEITLRGRVTEIGGLKHKVIGAHRAGIKLIIMPKSNKKDLEEIPEKVKKDLKFKFVDHLDQVLPLALHPLKRKASEENLVTDDSYPEDYRRAAILPAG